MSTDRKLFLLQLWKREWWRRVKILRRDPDQRQLLAAIAALEKSLGMEWVEDRP